MSMSQAELYVRMFRGYAVLCDSDGTVRLNARAIADPIPGDKFGALRITPDALRLLVEKADWVTVEETI